jgi:NAD(P)H-hydrate epimerase
MDAFLKKLYSPPKLSHKGQNGKLLVIGGSRRYHGAPVFSLLAARRFVDLMYFYPGENDQQLISAVKRIPEAMVVGDLRHTAEMDCVLFGIGLSDARFDVDFVLEYARSVVVDGDGLKLIKGRVPAGSILTPHEGEFRMLFGVEGTRRNVESMARESSCVIIKKDPLADIISDGKQTVLNKVHNQGMTKGGTGDVLAGLIAALACKNDIFTAAVAGAHLNGYAGNRLVKRFGYNFCASDLADELAPALKTLSGK